MDNGLRVGQVRVNTDGTLFIITDIFNKLVNYTWLDNKETGVASIGLVGMYPIDLDYMFYADISLIEGGL